MEFVLSCSECIVKQIAQIAEIKNIGKLKAHEIMRKVLEQLANADYSLSTPQLMGNVWDILEKEFDERDVYKEIKYFYDNALLQQENLIKENIESQQDDYFRFRQALIFAICGNLIDMAVTDTFDIQAFFDTVIKLGKKSFSIDDTLSLYEHLKSCKTLLYLGDNCGEIVTDKIFIQEIKRQFPQIHCYYAVRGFAILNDVTMFDADIVKMHQAATVISNGSKAAGTVLNDVSVDFKSIFDNADVIISKGQGNFESLHPIDNEKLFFLLMAKCSVIAKIFNVSQKSIICMKN